MADDVLVKERCRRRCLTRSRFRAVQVERLNALLSRVTELTRESLGVHLCVPVRFLLACAGRRGCERQSTVIRRYVRSADPSARAVESVASDK
ncbi:hypothetical protein D3C81_1320970 [compost metagenome]